MFNLNRELPRFGSEIAKDILDESPMLVVEGARQVGKSTLLNQVVGDREALSISLDNELARSNAQDDPRGFVEQAGDGLLIVDEAQRVPELALAFKASIDENRKPGRFAITGSSDLLRVRGVSDSLAGRAESLKVFPFSQGELIEREAPEDWVGWILNGGPKEHRFVSSDSDIRSIVCFGGYPEPFKRKDMAGRDRWFGSYIQRLVSHDATELAGKGEFADSLESLLFLMASQGQSELVKAKIARSLEISETALQTYLSLARGMFIIDYLNPWGIGYSGRAVRKPKVSLTDSGLASYLAGLTPEKARIVGGMELFGATLESFVATELRKQQTWSSKRFRLFHYRKREEEVDIVIELAGGQVILLEVKSAMDVDQRSWKNITKLWSDLGERVAAAVVLYTGKVSATINIAQGSIYVLPVQSLWEHP